MIVSKSCCSASALLINIDPMTSNVLYTPIYPSSTTHFSFLSFAGRNCRFLDPKALYLAKQETGHLKKLRIVRKGRSRVVAGTESTLTEKRPRVLVTGGGIGGLVFALAAKRKGFVVVVFEKDLSAIRGEGQYRGHIHIQSIGLAALVVIDTAVAEEVMNSGCVTGHRVNFGRRPNWFLYFGKLAIKELQDNENELQHEEEEGGILKRNCRIMKRN